MSNHGISEQFIDGMRSRMHVSHHKYGELKDSYPGKFKAYETALAAIRAYELDGNTEHLINASNYCMIEFQRPAHESPHFTPTDSDGSIGRVSAVSGRLVKE